MRSRLIYPKVLCREATFEGVCRKGGIKRHVGQREYGGTVFHPNLAIPSISSCLAFLFLFFPVIQETSRN